MEEYRPVFRVTKDSHTITTTTFSVPALPTPDNELLKVVHDAACDFVDIIADEWGSSTNEWRPLSISQKHIALQRALQDYAESGRSAE